MFSCEELHTEGETGTYRVDVKERKGASMKHNLIRYRIKVLLIGEPTYWTRLGELSGLPSWDNEGGQEYVLARGAI